MASESIAAAIRVSAFHNPSWLHSALDADHAWENTLIKVMEYINAVKKPLAAWRTILNGHFNRRKTDGGPIISSINDCTTIVPANGGAFEATLTIDNSLSVGDGLALSVSVIGDSKDDAMKNVCHKTFGLLLLTDASQVLLQPAQWRVSPNEIINATATFKRIYVEKWLDPSAIGDVRMGDEQPRVQPPPSARARAASSARPKSLYPLSPKQKEERDNRITNLLSMEIAAHGTAWPFELHRGRWRILNELLEPGVSRPWVDEGDQFKIIQDPRNPRRWGIAMA